MKILPLADARNHAADLATILASGGLVCFPIGGIYRIVADARSDAAINRLMQSKRRARNHPALLLVADLAAARAVVKGTAWRLTQRLAQRLWPGPLTLVLPPSDDLPPAVKKLLTRATGALGIRVPDEPLATDVVRAFGGPLLVSSANLEQKPGATSAAAIRQRFVHTVDLWIDAGDTRPGPPSTIVELSETTWTLVREGAISRAQLEHAAPQAA
ncbi:MAG: threonylcarbamoyl-AMP synthase [Deltaproteobacteria bacterium]|nr:threonylcarbamoyl-AMP synthase [Deltaproteobacteria bacterium]